MKPVTEGEPYTGDGHLPRRKERIVMQVGQARCTRCLAFKLPNLGGVKLRDVDKAYLIRYFDELGRCDNIVAWQYRQAVTAIEMLFEMLAVNPVLEAFNWEECREAARELAREHPTMARAVSSVETVARRAEKDAALNDPEVLRALGRLRDITRVRHLSIRTEQTYSEWAERFARFCKGPFPEDPQRVVAFLEHLALVEKVAPATQAQALNALVFLYRHVLQIELGDLGPYQRPNTKRKLPVVLSPREIDLLLDALTDTAGLMARLMYGTGMRLMECVRLRVKDIDWENGYIAVVGGKGDKSRRVPLPAAYSEELDAHLKGRKLQFEKDLAAGFSEVFVPESLLRKSPGLSKSWGWQYVFPAAHISTDPRSGRHMRHHISIRTATRDGGMGGGGLGHVDKARDLPSLCELRRARKARDEEVMFSFVWRLCARGGP